MCLTLVCKYLAHVYFYVNKMPPSMFTFMVFFEATEVHQYGEH